MAAVSVLKNWKIENWQNFPKIFKTGNLRTTLGRFYRRKMKQNFENCLEKLKRV